MPRLGNGAVRWGDIKVTIERIDPIAATQLLEQNQGNRSLLRRAVYKIANALTEGEWIFNGATVVIDEDGHVRDGQHRLHAVVESGVAIETIVVRGVPANVFEVIDCGRPKNAAVYLQIMGEQNCATLAAGLRWLWKYENRAFTLFHEVVKGSDNTKIPGSRNSPRDGRTAESYNSDLTNHQVGDMLDSHPDMRVSAQFSKSSTVTSWWPSGRASGLHYIFARSNPEQAALLFKDLAEGAGLKPNDAVLRLRNQVVDDNRKQRKRPAVQYDALMIKAWNARATATPCRQLKLQKGERFPEAVDFLD